MPQISHDDLAATLAAFAICLVAAIAPKAGNRTLEQLANELDDMAQKAPGTPMAETLSLCARNLIASEPG